MITTVRGDAIRKGFLLRRWSYGGAPYWAPVIADPVTQKVNGGRTVVRVAYSSSEGATFYSDETVEVIEK